MSELLETTLCGVTMKNPVIAASGTFGFGREYAMLFDVSKLGGISGKGLTLRGSSGNGGIRVWETPSGMMNSIGLENPGVQAYVEREAPFMRSLGTAVICNLGGATEQDYVEGTRLLNGADIDILELNISCPNVKAGGMALGVYPETAAYITRRVKAASNYPVMVKLTPAAVDLVGVAMAVEEAGADAIALINTIPAMAVDVEGRKPVFDNVYAGLSGPAIMPIALKMVHQVCRAVHIPVVGMGGIATAKDALAFMMVGASAVQVGTSLFSQVNVFDEIIEGLEAYCVKNALRSISEIRGII